MRRRLLFVLTLVAAVAAADGALSLDRTGPVRAAFERYDKAWRTFDAKGVVDAYADDFEWTNEVGLRFADKVTLRVFLARLFSDPAFRMAKPGPLVIRSIRLLGPGVAVVESREETDGQKDAATGKIVPVLHTNELTVLQRRGGRWLIVSDLTSDESHGV